jgi:hypothetical protein
VPALEALGFRVPGGSRRARSTSTPIARRSPTTASASRAASSPRRTWPITPGRDFGRNQPERHIRIAYTQPVARIREAMERIGKYIKAHA